MCDCPECEALRSCGITIDSDSLSLIFNDTISISINDLRLLRWKAAFYDRGIRPGEAAEAHRRNTISILEFREAITAANHSDDHMTNRANNAR